MPNVDAILDFSEERVLEGAATDTITLQHLDNFIERVASTSNARGIDISKVAKMLREEDVMQQTSRRTLIISLLGLISGFSIVSLLWYFMLFRNGFHCGSQPLNREVMPNTRELQVEPNETGVELEVAEDGNERRSVSPIVFVPRGRLAAGQP